MIQLLALTLLASANSAALKHQDMATMPLTAAEIVDVPSKGRFDYMAYDPKLDRIFASHPEAKNLTVYYLKSKKLREINTGAVNGVEVVPGMDRVYVGGKDQKILALDEKSLKTLFTATVTGPGDALAVDTKRSHVVLCHDDGTEDWAFDTDLKPLDPASITVAGAPEYIIYDPVSDMIYQNIKPTNQLQVIDPETLKVTSSWDTAPIESPHGLAIDGDMKVAVIAGGNGKAGLYSIADGKLITTADIAMKTDQMAYDPELHIAYCAGVGSVTALKVTSDGLTVLGNIPSPAGTHTLTVNTKTHDVWICWADKDGSAHLQRLQYKAN